MTVALWDTHKDYTLFKFLGERSLGVQLCSEPMRIKCQGLPPLKIIESLYMTSHTPNVPMWMSGAKLTSLRTLEVLT